MARMFQIVEVMRLMGVDDQNPRLNWAVGTQTAARWRKLYGTDPAGEMRPKTNNSPSVDATQMHRVYPEHFVPVIREIIESYDPANIPQMDLFSD